MNDRRKGGNGFADGIPAMQSARRPHDLAEAHINQGIALRDQGRLEEAIASYHKALAFKPDFSEAHYKLGVALTDQGKLEEAIASYRNALTFRPDYAEAHNNLGTLLYEQGRVEEAIASYHKALSFKPDLAEAHINLGNAFKDQGKLEEAIVNYRRALSFRPDYAEAHHNLGAVLNDLGRLDEAIASYRKALSFRPDLAEAHINLGNALKDQGKLEETIVNYRKALSFRPDYAEAHHNLGAVLNDLGRLDEAIASYRKALSFKPDWAEANVNLGNALKDQGDVKEAIASYRKALSTKPDLAEARWAIAMSKIPDVYGLGVSPSDRRAEFDAALAELENWFCAERVEDGYKSVGSQLPFLLAYQEENNRHLLSRYGALCCRLMNDWLRRQELRPAGTGSVNIVRLGIISRHFCNHSVWHALLQGWLQQLNRKRFELHLFHIGTTRDDLTTFAQRKATTFSQGRGGLRQWVETILAQQLDVLVYPEIGMDTMTVKLASMRLAPVQLCAWGHPETTGLPSIDYFISAEGLEPDDASTHYAERLIKLPHLGCFYPLTPVFPSEPDLAALAIDGTVPLLICPGTPFKYAPQHDWVFVDIARKLGKCQFVFFTLPAKGLSQLLQDRLRSVFTQAGLRYDDFVVSIPWQGKREFYGLMHRADVYLDTIGFSGFNTAMQAVECGLPIVTREGKFLRGRLASGILNRMGLSELVASTEEVYVALSVRLAKDAEYRQRMRGRIQESRNVLFDDLAPIKALEDFLISVTDRGATLK